MSNSTARIFALTIVIIAEFLGAVLVGPGLASAQINCSEEMDKWTSALQELRLAVERGEGLKNLSGAEAMREKAGELGNNNTLAAAVREVIAQKRSAWESAQAESMELMDREKTAYKSLSRCVSSGAAKKDAQLAADFRALSKERELVLSAVKKAFSDPAFAQYQNQQPPSPRDYEDPQYSYYRSSNRGYWGNYAPHSSNFFGR